MAARSELSGVDGKPLDAGAMEAYRSAPNGCVFTVKAPGGVHLLFLRESALPFKLPALVKDRSTGRYNGRSVSMTIMARGQSDTLSLSCWVPETTTPFQLASFTEGMNWPQLLERTQSAPFVPDTILQRPLSREAQQLRWERVKDQPKAFVAGRQATTTSVNGCDYVMLQKRANSHGLRANGDIVVDSCSCIVWISGTEPDGSKIFGYVCDIVFHESGTALQLNGMVTSAPSQSTFDYSALLRDLQRQYCGSSGCYDQLGTSFDDAVHVTLRATDALYEGAWVTFTLGITPVDSATGVHWNWVSEWAEDSTTSVNWCADYLDTMTCTMPVYGDGIMHIDVGTRSNGTIHQQVPVIVGIPSCQLGPSLDSLRRQYADSKAKYGIDTIPACNHFAYHPSGHIPQWPQIQSHGIGPLTSDWAIYKGSLDEGLVAMNNKWPVVINVPNQSVYRTPVKQLTVSRPFPNGRHIFGDAADLAVSNADWRDARDSALSLTPKPCIEPQTTTVPHLHMDYRILGGVTRPNACPPKWPHIIGEP